jgi:hypothetical protein
MDGIKIEVTGNIARIVERPARITAGTVGLPVEFSFDNQWEGLSKTAVFKAGCVEMIVENIETQAAIPWEITDKPNVWLSIGVYGVNADGTVAITTIWANICVICDGANPDGAVSKAPTPPVWQRLWNAIGNLTGLATNAKGNLVEAINEVNSIALAGGIESDPTLSQSGKAADAKATGDALAKKAPAGFGLGDANDIWTITNWGDLNLAKDPGWYKIVFDTWLPGEAIMRVDAMDKQIVQTFMQFDGVLTIGRRAKAINSDWGEFEWENPRMVAEQKYRTTERHQSSPVYTMVHSFGSLPNNFYISKKILDDDCKILRVEAYVETGNTVITLPYESNGNKIWFYATNSSVAIWTNSDQSDMKATVQVWYIKV